jgi:hypothetical protein
MENGKHAKDFTRVRIHYVPHHHDERNESSKRGNG